MNCRGLVGLIAFLMCGVSVAAVGPEHSGSWYWPEQSGHGFSIEIGEGADGSSYAIVYWYTYDTEGNPIFLVGQGTPDGDVVQLDFVSPVGMKFGEFDPETVQRQPGGLGRIEFSSADTANFQYIPSNFTDMTWGHSSIFNMPLVKLFGIPPCNVPCGETYALHRGLNDPRSEGYELTDHPANSAFGGTEQTESGIYDFWQVRDASTQSRSYMNYNHGLGESIMQTDWYAEAVVRVVEATPAVLVWDGLTKWGITLSNNSISVLPPAAGTTHVRVLDTRSDYRRYGLEFHANDPGYVDDTLSIYVDGELLFDELGREAFASECPLCGSTYPTHPYLFLGQGSSLGVGTANWHKVWFLKR